MEPFSPLTIIRWARQYKVWTQSTPLSGHAITPLPFWIASTDFIDTDHLPSKQDSFVFFFASIFIVSSSLELSTSLTQLKVLPEICQSILVFRLDTSSLGIPGKLWHYYRPSRRQCLELYLLFCSSTKTYQWLRGIKRTNSKHYRITKRPRNIFLLKFVVSLLAEPERKKVWYRPSSSSFGKKIQQRKTPPRKTKLSSSSFKLSNKRSKYLTVLSPFSLKHVNSQIPKSSWKQNAVVFDVAKYPTTREFCKEEPGNGYNAIQDPPSLEISWE